MTPGAIGATRLGIIVSAVIPACLPSFTATSLFALVMAVKQASGWIRSRLI